jgi:alkylation response protein AidB-like acyl-CoA dehydrogenase
MDFEFTERQRHVLEVARHFAETEVAPAAREADETGIFNTALVKRLAELGFLGGTLEPEYGGSGMDQVGFALVCEELGRADSSLRGFLSVHAGLVISAIRGFGGEEQRRHYLPRLAAGEVIGCYCLTEPEAGSDAASLQTTYREEEDAYVLNGEKIWITNGTIADVAIVFATRDPALRHHGISAFLVDTTVSGWQCWRLPGHELGHRASDHARLTFTECRIPKTSLLGEEGAGFKIAMSALDTGRIGVAAGAVGVGQACLDACVDFARKRRQFGRRIGDFQQVQAAVANMAADIEAARFLTYHAAWLKDKGRMVSREAAIAKLFATEAAARAASEAVLLHGNRGYSDEYPVERYYRDIKGLQIYEGTSYIQRVIIARDLLGQDPAQDATQ